MGKHGWFSLFPGELEGNNLVHRNLGLRILLRLDFRWGDLEVCHILRDVRCFGGLGGVDQAGNLDLRRISKQNLFISGLLVVGLLAVQTCVEVGSRFLLTSDSDPPVEGLVLSGLRRQLVWTNGSEIRINFPELGYKPFHIPSNRRFVTKNQLLFFD